MTKPSQPAPKVDSHVTAQGIEILRVGKFADTQGREVEFTAADLADIAASYDPQKGEAPLVIGHPETNGPAHGWVTGLRVDGERLVADAAKVPLAFAEAVNAGTFKKRSASIYPKTAKNNPAPGKFYLRHVGFLGAAVPAVTGLRDFTFAADDDCIELAAFDAMPRRTWWAFSSIADLFRGLRDRVIETDGIEKADRLLPNYSIDSIRDAAREADLAAAHSYADTHAPVTVVSPPAAGVPAAGKTGAEDVSTEDEDVNQKATELADREAALNEREQRIKDQEKQAAERAATEIRNDASNFADGLVKEGRLLPKDKIGVVELLLALPSDKPLTFADGDTQIEKPATELFRDFLSGLPKQIDFSEKAGGTGDGAALTFAAPPDAHVDANQLDLHARAKAYQAQNPSVSWAGAVKAVGGR